MKHFNTIKEYCEAIQVPPPKHDLFDIRSFEENMPTVVHQMLPFRHAFYAIAIKVGGRGKAVSGHFQDFPEGSVIFFNSPFQILSWDIAPDWKGYYIMITQDFLAKTGIFNNLLEQFPFLKIDRSIPFNVEDEDANTIMGIYEKIYQEYHGQGSNKFDLIAAYVLLLLEHVKRCFVEQVPEDEAAKELRTADVKLLSRYQKLIELSLRFENVSNSQDNLHSPSYYAERLSVHPNYLNAVAKGISGKTALQHIHSHLLLLAKSYLSQTDLSIKEIAFRLQFDIPNAFTTFFKKHTNETPGSFRKSVNL